MCDNSFDDVGQLNLHIHRRHSREEPTLLPQSVNPMSEEVFKPYWKSIIEQNHEIFEELHEFKKYLSHSLGEIQRTQGVLMEEIHELNMSNVELKVSVNRIGSDQVNSSNRMENIFSQVKILENQHSQIHEKVEIVHNAIQSVATKSKQHPEQYSSPNSTERTDNKQETSNTTPSSQPCSSNQRNENFPCERCDFKARTSYQLKRHNEVRHYGNNKMLYIGDSIVQNIDVRYLEKRAKTYIKTARAYTTDGDNSEVNPLRDPPRIPDENFKDVVESELEKDDYKYLVLGSSSADITNLNTVTNPESNLEFYEHEAIKSAQIMFTLAEAAIFTFKNLKKVVIMNSPPRFDTSANDPLALKPQLSSLINSSYFHFWSHSQYRDKIVLGQHDIPHTLGNSHHEGFGSQDHPHYDGIHLIGPRGRSIVTNSISNIFLKADIIKTEPNKTKYDPKNMWSDAVRNSQPHSQQTTTPTASRPSVIKSNQTQDVYNVPVYNPYETLGN